MGFRSPHLKGQFCGRNGAGLGHARTCSAVDIGLLKSTHRGQHQYGADADWGELDAMHVCATWRIRLSPMCATAMRPYVKVLRPLVMAALWNRAGHYIFAALFLLSSSSSFPRLFSAVVYWMCTIFPHMVWF